MKEPVNAFDWERIFTNELPWLYLGEVAFRTVFMFIVLLAALTVSGKREVRQLSIYELVLVIGLGSAAGDPMFYSDAPLSSAVVVFVVLMSCYKLTTYISDRNKPVRKALEGLPVYVIENGCILWQTLEKEDIGVDELFADLRVEGIEHLGQVKVAIIEPSGQVSVFRCSEKEVIPGLPILPKALKKSTRHPDQPGSYACSTCGTVQAINSPSAELACPSCTNTQWVKAAEGAD